MKNRFKNLKLTIKKILFSAISIALLIVLLLTYSPTTQNAPDVVVTNTVESTLQIVPEVTDTKIPEITVVPTIGNIPTPDFSYDCFEYNGSRCIHPNDTAIDLITHTIFNSGGMYSYQISVDLLQIIYNNVYSAWTCLERNSCPTNERGALNPNHISWLDVDSDTFTRLVLFVISSPYVDINNVKHSVFTGWQLPLPASINRIPRDFRLYNDLRTAVEVFLSAGVTSEPWNVDIQLIESSTGNTYYSLPALHNAGIQCFYVTTDIPSSSIRDSITLYNGQVLYINYSWTLDIQP